MAIDTPPVDQVIQWALEDILDRKQPPSPDIIAMIEAGSEASNIISFLSGVLRDSDDVGLKHAFMGLCKKHPWLGDLRSKPVPPRPGTEGEQKTEDEDPRFIKGKKEKQVLKLSSIEDIYNLSDPDYLISKVLQTGSVSLLYGVSGTGKTFTCLDLALSIAHGLPWHGRKVKQGSVWYINTEGGRSLKKRLKAWYLEHPRLSPSPNFKVIPWSLDLRENYQMLLDTLEEQEEAPILITFDNFSMCTDKVNQNLQDEVASILKRLHYIADKYGCHIMMVHHTNKEGDVNGTMAFRNHVDAMIELKKEDKAEKDSPIIFSSQKARDDEPFNDIRTELKQVKLHADPETGEWVTSCIIVDCNQAEPDKIVPESQIQVLEILNAHVQLTCSQWLKHCSTMHQMSDRTFYRLRGVVEKEGLVSIVAEKTKGKTTYYSLTDKGRELIE